MTDVERILDNLGRDCPKVKVELDRPLSILGFTVFRLRGRVSGEVRLEVGAATIKGASAKFREEYARALGYGLL